MFLCFSWESKHHNVLSSSWSAVREFSNYRMMKYCEYRISKSLMWLRPDVWGIWYHFLKLVSSIFCINKHMRNVKENIVIWCLKSSLTRKNDYSSNLGMLQGTLQVFKLLKKLNFIMYVSVVNLKKQVMPLIENVIVISGTFMLLKMIFYLVLFPRLTSSVRCTYDLPSSVYSI